MTPEEILKSLSSLEKELANIKSARELAEDTITACKEVQKEIKSFITKFEDVAHSLNLIAQSFESGQASIETEVKNSIDQLQIKLNPILNEYSAQYESLISKFQSNVKTITNKLTKETSDLLSDFDANNKTLKSSITELKTIHTSLLKATESVTSLKAVIATLQSQLIASQTEQDKVLNDISDEIQDIAKSLHQHFTKLAKQFEELNALCDSRLTTVISSIDLTSKSINDGVSKVFSVVESNTKALQNQINESTKATKSAKFLIIINLIITFIAILVAFIK